MSDNRTKALQDLRDGKGLTNRGNYWTDEELDMLEYMYKDQLAGISELALFFGRNELSICQQALKMGLMDNQLKPRGPRRRPCRCQCSKCIILDCPNRRELYSEN